MHWNLFPFAHKINDTASFVCDKKDTPEHDMACLHRLRFTIHLNHLYTTGIDSVGLCARYRMEMPGWSR